jgi:hypothetical protein
VSGEQDRRLRRALRGLQPPPPSQDARERVRAAVAAAAASKAADHAEEAAGSGRRRRRMSRWLSDALSRRRRAALALAAVVVAVAVVGAVLVGLPGGGPEPVSAAEVLHRALRALSSGRTLAADVTLKALDADMSSTESRYDVDHYRLLLRADGSYRLTRRGPSETGWSPAGDSPPPLETVFDARRGILSTYSPTRGVIVRSGSPPGPPDSWAGVVTQYDFSAGARALRVAGAARLQAGVYEGRPTWIVTCSLGSRPSQPAITDQWPVYEITIDQDTSFPVRFRALQDDEVQLEVRYDNVRVDDPLPAGAFTLTPPAGAAVSRKVGGFRYAPVAELARLAGYAVLVPGSVPPGYRRTAAATAPRAVTANDLVRGRNVVSLHYTRGFDSLTVTTRTVPDPEFAAEWDPFELEHSWAVAVARPATIRDGAFQGVTAKVVVAPRTTVPHLWAVKGGLLLTVAGSATADELLTIASSLEVASP